MLCRGDLGAEDWEMPGFGSGSCVVRHTMKTVLSVLGSCLKGRRTSGLKSPDSSPINSACCAHILPNFSKDVFHY